MKVSRQSFIEELKWNPYMLKLILLMASLERKKAHLRKKYCRYGFHKLKQGSTTKDTHGRITTVHYLYCAICDYKFFATKRDKEWYIKNNHFG